MNMRRLKKLTVAVLTVALVLTSMTTVFATTPATIANADKAVTLKDLGLYSGQDANDPKVGLENALTTQDSLIFLAKLFGYNEAANKLTADEVAKGLAKFDDAASISEYAKNVVAYSATNGILSGSTKDGKFFVGAKDTVTAARFATFMLKQMGITVADYKVSVAKLAETKGSKVDATLTGDLNRDAAVGIMYGALTAEKASGKTVIADIVGNNADLQKKAIKAGLMVAEPTQDSGKTGNTSGSGSTGNTSGGGSTGNTGGGGSSSGDVTGPTVKSVSVEKNLSVKLTFSEVLKASTVNLSNFTFKSVEDGQAVSFTVEYPVDEDNKVVRLNVAEKLDDNTEYEVVVKKAIKDATGNQMKNDYLTTFTIGDVTGPTVNSVSVEKNLSVKLAFNEVLKENTVNLSNFTFKSVEDGQAVSFTVEYPVDEDNKVVRLNVAEKLDDNTEYEVVVKKEIEDAAGNQMKNDYVTTVTTGDNVPPEIDEDDCRVVKAEGKIYLKFSKPMDQSQMLNHLNYRVQPKNGADWHDVDSNEISKISERVVLIVLDEDIDSPDVEIKSISDLAGNPLFGSTASKTLIDINVELELTKIKSADLIATNKIKVEFNTELATFNAADVILSLDRDSVTTPGSLRIDSVESQTVNDHGNTEIVLTLNEDINTDATVTSNREPIYIITEENPLSTSVFGIGLSKSNKDVGDKTPPEVVMFNYNGLGDLAPYVVTSLTGDMQAEGTEGYIYIAFTESILSDSLSIDAFEVDGYTILDVEVKGDNENVIFLRVKADSDDTKTYPYVTKRPNICDMLGNEFVASDSEIWKVRPYY